MPKLPLAVVINTKNAEHTVAKALASVEEMAEQIIVMDMWSEDKTREVAEKFTKDVYKTDKDFEYVEPARNAALAKVNQEWVLILDADEEVSVGLKKEIEDIISEHTIDAECLFIPRRNVIFGKEMNGTGWWPDFQMRLFKRGKVIWSDKIHSVPELHGKVAYLPVDAHKSIIHQNFQKVDQFVSRLNRYTSIESISDKNEKSLSAAKALADFNDEFLRRMFEQKGIDEGIHGLGLSLLQSSYQLISALKQWEKNGFTATSGDQFATFSELQKFQKDLNYWIADWQVNHATGVKKMAWQIRRKLKL